MRFWVFLFILCLPCFAISGSGIAALAQEHQSQAWPDVLALQNGTIVHNRAEFEQQRRPEILRLFEENVYGKTPAGSLAIRVVHKEVDPNAMHGLVRRIQTTLAVGPNGELTWHILQYMPAHVNGPVPVFIGLNFHGNQTVNADPGIEINPIWVPDPALKRLHIARELCRHILVTPAETTRGSSASRWPIEQIVSRGYGLATMYLGEIEPDFAGGIGYGIRPLFFDKTQSIPAADDWGAIGAWAWGMSRIIDLLTRDPAVDAKGIIAFGHSRLGKTALWAAAQDTRFAAAISNESGHAGATLSHRERGESIDHLVLTFPYWFCANYQHYVGRAKDLPLDGHMLLALIAPRPLYIGSAIGDLFSDPEGEFLSARAASRVYALYGETGVTDASMPAPEHPIGDVVRYHVRSGGHNVTAYDWDQYLNFADSLIKNTHHSR